VANTLVENDTATITAVISLILMAQELLNELNISQ
jgi:hypothetical protein